jgi:hypothetical protein
MHNNPFSMQHPAFSEERLSDRLLLIQFLNLGDNEFIQNVLILVG